MYLASYDPKEFGSFQSVAGSGQESIAQGKPWAMLSCPFGVGPSGRMTGAKQQARIESLTHFITKIF
jgi:hypothetical protein